MKLVLLITVPAMALALHSCAPVRVIPPRVTAPALQVGHLKILPTGYKTVTVSGTKYYTHAGKYWRYRNGVYVNVARPPGLAVTPYGVRVLPRGHKVIRVRGKKYYKWGGKYHKWHPRRGYIVVRP